MSHNRDIPPELRPGSLRQNRRLPAALVSMLSLETAMLEQFGGEKNPEAFRQIMTGATGGCVCAMVLAMALYMILRSTGQRKQIRNAETSEQEDLR